MSKSIVVLCRSVDPEGVLPEGGKVAGEGGGGASAEMGSKTDCGYIEPGPEGGSIHVYIQVTLVLHFHLSLTLAAFDLEDFQDENRNNSLEDDGGGGGYDYGEELEILERGQDQVGISLDPTVWKVINRPGAGPSLSN